MTPDEVSRALFHHAPAGLFAMTTDGVILSANDTFCQWAGAAREDIVGRYFLSLLSRGSKLIFETRFMPLLQTQRTLNEVMLSLSTGTGSTRDVLVSSVLDDSGDQTMVFAAVVDAGIRLKYERDLLDARRTAESAVARVRILQHAAAGLAPATTMAAFGSALRVSAEIATDAASVSVVVAEPDGRLDLVSGTYPLSGTVDLAGLLPVQECLSHGRVVLCRSPADIALSFPSLAADLDAEGVEALCVIPVIEDGTVGGAIACWFQRPRELDENLLDLLAALATQAAPVLERIHLQRRIEHQSLHDSLTGLPNRFAMQQRLRQLLVEAEPLGRTVAVLFLDLDGFKAINDAFGHEAGDQVLQQVAERLLRTLRVGDLPSRFGGDEFVIACDGVDEGSVLEMARRIRDAVRVPLGGIAEGQCVSASIGISVFTPGVSPLTTPGALIALADEAMLASKRAGKGRDTLVTA
ncbi:sensor domain-containing diguanylate cyclase [Cryobacterium sp. SO2]|uniref:sensor domain-containing diguanylate cyclase n=1 Tax=Cryobacterium sp. SO2 TaxID=1897060 RepID=UPI00223D0F34|nr:sensor domain-containing diguanylate cyclase [Cryobacterium sp. SO2]WEO77902.1 sensor domain-containing diguanylate cyclase [Cryobacterium sp. SO2]